MALVQAVFYFVSAEPGKNLKRNILLKDKAGGRSTSYSLAKIE